MEHRLTAQVADICAVDLLGGHRQTRWLVDPNRLWCAEHHPAPTTESVTACLSYRNAAIAHHAWHAYYMYPLCGRFMCCCCSLPAQLNDVYRALLKAGIPADLQTGSFFDAIEVKTALALLRAVADPERAGEALEQRIIVADSDVKVPLTAGLGKWRAVQAGP